MAETTSTTEAPTTRFDTTATTVPITSSSTTTTIATTTTPYDPCHPNPCRNGATCIGQGTTYKCTCTSGFTSSNCDVEINECESNPCYPFGKCTDLVADYNCSCNPGYETFPNDTKTCKEVDFCAKEAEPCLNNGTCTNQNELSRYYCICPELDGKKYVGLKCETELITKPTVNGGISPTSGIIAGGANVTIRGQGLNLFDPLGAYLIDTNTSSALPSLYAYVIPNLTLNDSITVQIPPANQSYVNRSMLMIVEYTGPTNVTSVEDNLRFNYSGNPVITTIEPTEILVLGGVHLTVSGDNMDTVQNPMMDITTFVVNVTTGISETNHSRESCSLKNQTAITCLVPPGIVPESFFDDAEPAEQRLGVVHLASSFYHRKRRRTKRAPVSNLTDDAGSTFELYLGFIFDAFPTYENISKSLPNVSISLVGIEVSFTPGCSMDFVSNKQDTISLHGGGLTVGCSMSDYKVFVSNATCIVTSLTDNVLQCQPPKDEPILSDNSLQCDSAQDPHPVKVFIGGLSYLGCCVSYTTDNTALIVGVAVTVVIVVAIIILITVLLVKRHRKNQEQDLTMLTYLRRKLYSKRKPTKPYSIPINGEDPPNLVQGSVDSINQGSENANHRQTGVPQLSRDEITESDSTRDGVNRGNQKPVVEFALRNLPTGTRQSFYDYLISRDVQMVSDSDVAGRMGGTRGFSSGPSRNMGAHVDEIGQLSFEGPVTIDEPEPDYLTPNDIAMTLTDDPGISSFVPSHGQTNMPYRPPRSQRN